MAGQKGEGKETTPQVVTPMIAYEDAAAAIDWLCRAFGFTERMRMEDASGTVTHAELELNGGVVMLAQPTTEYRSPARHAEECDQARRWLSVPFVIDGAHVLVPDVDAHFQRAKTEGATILSEPEDQPYGERTYRAADLEGHRWMFAQTL